MTLFNKLLPLFMISIVHGNVILQVYQGVKKSNCPCDDCCDCDQSDSCTNVGGQCQQLGAVCDTESNPTLCSGDSCTCCYGCDQSDTCTEIDGVCQPLGAVCGMDSNPTLCSGDNCTCCNGCDQSDPCTDVNGVCWPLGANCELTSDHEFCFGDDCFCCYDGTIIDTTHPISTTTPNPSATTHPMTTIDPGSCTLMGQFYAPGTVFEMNCMAFFCENNIWYSSREYNAICGECSFNNDPHFTSFDGKKFDWHGHSAYVISEGCEVCPDSFVHSLFVDCVDGLDYATCVNTVYFQPEPNTYIQIVKAEPLSNSQIIIDGYVQYVDDTGYGPITVLKGGYGVEHPAFAWMNNGCIHIMGFNDEGYLVKICEWTASVFAYPTMKNNLCGLCGNWDGDSSNDLRYRNGSYGELRSQTGDYWWDLRVDPNYGNDWEVQGCGLGSFKNPTTMMPLTTPAHVDEVNSCNVSTTVVITIITTCEGLVHVDALKYFVGECVFDQCVAQCASVEIQIKWLQNTKNSIKQAEEQINDTVYPEGCPYDNSTVHEIDGTWFIFFSCPRTFAQARAYCFDDGMSLATPDEHFDWFNDVMPRGAEVWLDVRPDRRDPDVWYWQTSPKIETTPNQWQKNTIRPHPPNCASLVKYDGLLNYDCDSRWYFACENDGPIAQRKDVGEVNFPPRAGPERNLTRESNI